MNTPASYPKRVAALLLDVILESVIPFSVFMLSVISVLFDLRASLTLFLVSLPLWAVFSILNRVILQGRRGHTLGKQLMGIRLVSGATNQPVGIWTALLRFVVTLLIGGVSGGLLLLIDCLWPAFDPYGRRVTDRLLGTMVVDAGFPTLGTNHRHDDGLSGWL